MGVFFVEADIDAIDGHGQNVLPLFFFSFIPGSPLVHEHFLLLNEVEGLVGVGVDGLLFGHGQ